MISINKVERPNPQDRAADNKFMYADWWGGRKTRSYTFEGS